MSAIGIDLNGALDSVARLDQQPRLAPVPPVVIQDAPQGILTGAEAILSPFGRPGLTETGGTRLGILELLQRLAGTSPDAPLLLGQHLRSLLPPDERDSVIAVPDTPAFNERARARLLDGAAQAGVNARLLWRPVAALLGWGETLTVPDLQALNGQSACVIQWLPEGIAISQMDLESLEQGGRITLVPVRRRDGLRAMHPYPEGDLPQLLAAEAGVADSRQIWTSAWAWNALLGRPAESELLPDAGSPSSWRIVEGLSTLRGVLANAMQTVVNTILHQHQPVLQDSAVILIEGPLAQASIKLQLRNAIPLGAFCKSKLTERIPSIRTIQVLPIAESLVARGCAVCAVRQARGQITYYDFLPMLEIPVRRGDEYLFSELINRQDRVAGGSTYTNTLFDRFVITGGTNSLLKIYLLKEDEKPPARYSETVLPIPPDQEVKISLHVTQTPAQGYARVEIRPEVQGALGNKPILLDWNAMAEIPLSREQILLEFEFQGIGYPDIAPQQAHILIWEKTAVFNEMQNFINCPVEPLPRNRYDWITQQARVVFGTRKTPFFLTKGNDRDQTLYATVDSDGHLPMEIAPNIIDAFDAFREKIGHDFVIVSKTNNISNRRTKQYLARLGATLHTSCPESIVSYFRSVVIINDNARKLVLYAGKIFSNQSDLMLLFKYCMRRYYEALDSNIKLSWFVVNAAGDALAFREQAGKIIDPMVANSLTDSAIDVLSTQIQNKNFRITFKAALRLIAFLLRHRLQRRDFLHPKSPDAQNRHRAERIIQLLKQASGYDSLTESLQNNISEIQKHILYRGSHSMIDIIIDEDGDASDDTNE